jgi:catechol 2,3-dioxygenase-like lactoylglutathione lyase family enzyme
MSGGLVVGLHHVQVMAPVGGEDDLRRFYVGVVGMTEVAKPPALALRGGVWFEAAGFQVHCGVAADFVPARRAHPCIVVSDLDQLARRCEGAGLPVTWDENIPGVRRFHTTDTVGNRIELQQA